MDVVVIMLDSYPLNTYTIERPGLNELSQPDPVNLGEFQGVEDLALAVSVFNKDIVRQAKNFIMTGDTPDLKVNDAIIDDLGNRYKVRQIMRTPSHTLDILGVVVE